jgi:hypothetical protein
MQAKIVQVFIATVSKAIQAYWAKDEYSQVRKGALIVHNLQEASSTRHGLMVHE